MKSTQSLHINFGHYVYDVIYYIMNIYLNKDNSFGISFKKLFYICTIKIQRSINGKICEINIKYICRWRMGEGRAGRRTIKSMEKYFFNEIYEYLRVTNLLHKHWEKIPDPVPSVSIKFQMKLQFSLSNSE